MSKVICEVCGTAYPEASAQCPICGCVRPVDARGIPGNADDAAQIRKYEHVKGGRFSKANVRKRTAGVQSGTYSKPAKVTQEAPVKRKNTKKKDNGNTGLVITILVLLLAIIAVVAYIIVKFFIPVSVPEEVPSDPVITEAPTEPSEETFGEVPCQDLSLDAYEITLESAGDHTYLMASPTPFDTTDEIIFESADSSVAMAESDGRITAVSKGETDVIVTCGSVSVRCEVTVGIVKETLQLNRQEITFESAGDTWTVYSGNIPVDQITWSSDDESVATVEDGIVTAVGDGVTMIYGNYDGQIQSCVIRCSFVESETDAGTEGNGGVSSDAEDVTEATEETQSASNKYKSPYKLKNLMGPSSEDVMIAVGESFTLALVDSDGTRIDGVTWSVDGSACSVSGGTVKGLRSGYCEVVATYDGQTYKCIVRVK